MTLAFLLQGRAKPLLPSNLWRLLSDFSPTALLLHILLLDHCCISAVSKMDEDLTERFGRSRSAFRPQSERAEVWVLPQRLNEKVKGYYDELNSPVAAGEWATRAEIPTSSEIMDEATSSTGGSAGGSSEVLIPLNKRKGAWSSKGGLTRSFHAASVKD